MQKSKRSMYSAKFELEEVKFAQNLNNSAAGSVWRSDEGEDFAGFWLQFSQQTARRKYQTPLFF